MPKLLPLLAVSQEVLSTTVEALHFALLLLLLLPLATLALALLFGFFLGYLGDFFRFSLPHD